MRRDIMAAEQERSVMRLGPQVGRMREPGGATMETSGRQPVSTPHHAITFATALPEVEANSHHDHNDYRIRGKVFLSFPEADRITLKLNPDFAQALVHAQPETFLPHPGMWGKRGWTRVILADVAPERLAELIEMSWLLVAPVRLRKRYLTAQADQS
ncbi:MAG TPA: MmcQ/YjbR family DNA-binding protein [Thermomicrobiales bacterium]|nr:MmcQ/YjbR family DNA-binding protein [Thermomicrobiales bacterium]HRA47584.1 MmcQ/YjbR family DNA-binding protein [Thermomicrobiales bacterium]